MNEALAPCAAHKRIAIYQRVSSETQRERETIKTQAEALDRAVGIALDVEVAETYVDDGVSGTKPFSMRPAGAQLLVDAARGLFDELWVYRYDRLARDEIESLLLRRHLTNLGVTLYSVSEGYSGDLLYGIQAVMAGEERRVFLARSAEGMNRAAKEGRYCGGIAPYGYLVQGRKNTARLVPAEEELPGCLMSQAEVVRHIYDRLASDGWSCRQIAGELNDLGVPTKYALEGRGMRGKSTQGLWGAGRIRNMVTNPVYRGQLHYGRRTNKRREVVTACVQALVSEKVWRAAQETLTRNRCSAKNTPRVYLLRGVMRCGICGRAFCGSQHHGSTWYRCDGTLGRAETTGGRCQAKILKGEVLEEVVWSDVERFLRDPGDILSELEAEVQTDPVQQSLEKERARWQAAQADWQARRERLLELYEGGHRTKQEMEERLGPIMASLSQATDRVAALDEQERELEPIPVSAELLEAIHARLSDGLSAEKRAEIVRLLVRSITVNTDVAPDGKKTQQVFVDYRFPRVSATYAGTDS